MKRIVGATAQIWQQYSTFGENNSVERIKAPILLKAVLAIKTMLEPNLI